MKGNSNREASLAEASRLLGRSRNAVAAWLAESCPSRSERGPRGTVEHRLDLARVVVWLEDRAARREREKLTAQHEHELERLRKAIELAGTESEPVSRSEALRRRAVAAARMAEIELAEREGEMAPTLVTEVAIVSLCSGIQNRVLGIASTVAVDCAAATDPAETQGIVYRACTNALTALAEAKVVHRADERVEALLVEFRERLRKLARES